MGENNPIPSPGPLAGSTRPHSLEDGRGGHPFVRLPVVRLPEEGPSSPLHPVYVLRGHSAQINSVHFLRSNSRLLTGDADGWVILWKISSRRPVAVWKPHDGALLGAGAWGSDRIITHGRDNKLYAWKLGAADEAGLTTNLPVEAGQQIDGRSHRAPWLLHSLNINALNFCSFAMCYEHHDAPSVPHETITGSADNSLPVDPILIALPSALDSDAIDIMQLPSGNRIHSSIGLAKTSPTVVSSSTQSKTGMVMSLSLFYHPSKSNYLMLAAGFESGHVCLFGCNTKDGGGASSRWETSYAQTVHLQPVLSIAIPDQRAIPSTASSLYILSSAADSIIAKHPIPDPTVATSHPPEVQKVTTHHTGQQSLSIRSDARIFATAGWDGKVRVYAARTLKELAVLKWHRDGCYAVAFGEVGTGVQSEVIGEGHGNGGGAPRTGMQIASGTVDTFKSVSLAREEREQARHWIAAGSKDGKVSLWEVY